MFVSLLLKTIISMKKLILAILLLPLGVVNGQFGLEFGGAAFESNLGFVNSAPESFAGLYGQANIKINSAFLSFSADATSFTENNSTVAVVCLGLGVQSYIELGSAGNFALCPGLKFGSYGIAYDDGVNVFTESHLGIAPRVDFVIMIGKAVGFNFALEYNILDDGEFEGNAVDGFEYLEANAGIKLFFGNPRADKEED